MNHPLGNIVHRVLAEGNAARLTLTAYASSRDDDAQLDWVHLDGVSEDGRAWLEEKSGLDDFACEALLARETRPQAVLTKAGVLLILRGVNRNPDADPEDLVSIRLWITARRVISLSYRPLLALEDLGADVLAGLIGDPGDLIAELSRHLIERLEATLADLNDTLDTLEDDIIEERMKDLRERLGRTRRIAIGLRRYISPQREALLALIAMVTPIFNEIDRQQLREAANRVMRMSEELDAARDRAVVLSDQLSDLRAEAVASRTLVLSVVSSVFLPLTFLTGLIGMNVAGIPFAEQSWAFGAIVLTCVAIAGSLLLWLRQRDWF